MRKLTHVLGLLAGILFAVPTFAAPALACQLLTGSQVGISCTCSAGTCDQPPTYSPSAVPTKPTSTPAATASVRLGPQVTVVDVEMCPTTAAATITAAKVDLWIYDGGGWAVMGPTCTGTTSRAANGCVYVQCDSPGKGIPLISKRPAWLQVVPNGTTTSAGGVRIRVFPSGPAGAL